MASLYCAGHIQGIFVKPSATLTEIEAIIMDAFSGLEAIQAGDISMEFWQILSKVSHGHGEPPVLRPHKGAGNVSCQDLQW